MDEYAGVSAILYDALSTGIPGDADFYTEEALRAGSPVLELGCGTGRITAQVAAAGMQIVGLDRSPDMLAIARRKIDALGPEIAARVTLVEGDMRQFRLEQRFRLIMIPYRAFLHLLTPQDQRAALTCIREHLAEGGLLALNIFDPRLDIIVERMGGIGGAHTYLWRELVHPENGHRVLVSDTRRYDPAEQRLDQWWIFEELDEGGAVVAKHYAPLALRYIHRYEMAYLLELCGFRVEALYGDLARGPFCYGGEQVWLARRASDAR
jgi:SAM-dependent methyltransferase